MLSSSRESILPPHLRLRSTCKDYSNCLLILSNVFSRRPGKGPCIRSLVVQSLLPAIEAQCPERIVKHKGLTSRGCAVGDEFASPSSQGRGYNSSCLEELPTRRSSERNGQIKTQDSNQLIWQTPPFPYSHDTLLKTRKTTSLLTATT